MADHISHSGHEEGLPEGCVYRLSEPDGEVLDAILGIRSKGQSQGPMPAESAPRAEKVSELLSVLDLYTAEEPSDDLISRTLARVDEARQEQRLSQQIQMLSRPVPSTGVSWRQVVMVASVFLVAFALLIPVLERNRANARETACASNLSAAGKAFQQYASDNEGMLPRWPVKPGEVWWNVGQDHGQLTNADTVHSNSAHCYILARQQYMTPEELDCPANPFASGKMMTTEHFDWPTPQAVSYSYQNQYRSKPLELDANPNLAILADKNPLFIYQSDRMTFDGSSPVTAPSHIHNGRGQNILTADGAVQWTLSPFIRSHDGEGRDNVWLMNGVEDYSGTESPDDPEDNFLVP